MRIHHHSYRTALWPLLHLSACMHAHGMFVNIASRDLFIQQCRPVHPGNVVHMAGLEVHAPVVLMMAFNSHENQSHSE